ncbi:MAG: hypothetical protein FWD27_04255 [Coriobacteriia bacterium]|nr:hypothetical protein [Coriobacteriia bacterium]
MHTVIIDPEFRDLLPPLSPESYAALEASLLEHGVRDSLVVWRGHNILVDGHNRYGIAIQHGLSFNVVEVEFDSREAVLIFIVSNQISRRNLPPLQFSYYVGLHYRADKLISGRPSLDTVEEKLHQNEGVFLPTAKRLAEKYKVSKSTVERAAKMSEGIDAIASVSNDARKKIISGDVRISKKKLTELATASQKELTEVAKAIEDGNYTTKESANATPEPNGSSSSALGSGTPATIAPPATLQDLKAQINQIRTTFDLELASLTSQNASPSAAKPALQAYLSKLESILRDA